MYVFLLIYTAANISSIRYGSPDDLSISSAQFGNIRNLDVALTAARETGRIQQIPFYLINLLALHETPYFLTQSIKFISVVLIFILYSVLIKQLYSYRISLISSLFLIATLATTGEYNALNSFPLWFSLGVISFILSAIFFANYISDQKLYSLVLCQVTFFVALLSSEIYFLLILVFPAIQFIKSDKKSIIRNLFKLKKFYLSISSFSVLYFLVYQSFKYFTKGTYEGTQLTLSNPFKSIFSALALSVGQFNIYGLKRQIYDHDIYFNFLFGFCFLIFFILIFKLLSEKTEESELIKNKEIITLFGLSLSANLLLGFTVKYSQVGLTYPLYLHSLISYLFLSLAVSLILFKLTKHRFLLLNLLVIISISGYFSFTDQFTEYKTLRSNQNIFRVVDCMIQNQKFIDKLSDNIVSSDIQILSKSYSYNYFGEKLRKYHHRNFYFYLDLPNNYENNSYSEINLDLNKSVAKGTLINFNRGSVKDKYAFVVEYKSCLLSLRNL
jgi:hypothetical protein